MHFDSCNGFLNAIALFNDGANHASTYTMELLPAASSLDSSLATYFSAMSTSHVPPQPAEKWQIQTTELDDDWAQALRQVAHHWFFEQAFSPKVDQTIAENVVETFLAHVRAIVGDAKAFQVDVSPPMWYEGVWQDLAFDSQQGRWLLHFGVSD